MFGSKTQMFFSRQIPNAGVFLVISNALVIFLIHSPGPHLYVQEYHRLLYLYSVAELAQNNRNYSVRLYIQVTLFHENYFFSQICALGEIISTEDNDR